MSNDRAEGQFMLAVIGGAVLLIVAMVWKFSEALGLDMATGGRVISGLVAAAGVLAIAWWNNGFGLFNVKAIWPVSLGLIWMAFWPAMNVWGAVGPAWASNAGIDIELVWWAAWYTKGAVLVLIVGGGWWLNSILGERY